MMSNWIFSLMIPMWGYVVIAVILGTFLLPERIRYLNDGRGSYMQVNPAMVFFWSIPFLWFVPPYLLTPGTGDEHFDQFWTEVGRVWQQQGEFSNSPYLPVMIGAYLVVGAIWAIAHFWLYARRLGHLYVLERDNWLSAQGGGPLEQLSNAQKAEFTKTVIGAVKEKMLYVGDFPLRPFQQKRFFTGNVLMWPATLGWYLLADLVCDIARSIWFALRRWVHAKWSVGMTEYIDDDGICRGYAEELAQIVAKQVAAAKAAKEAQSSKGPKLSGA